MKKNKYVICTHHGTHFGLVEHWKNSGIEFDFLTDVTNTPLSVGLQYTEDQVRKMFNFQGEVSKKHYWNSYGNRNIIWFYAHFRMMYYYILNPNYEYYWFFDDDVTIKEWKIFLDSFEDNKSDFISYYCFKNTDVNSQNNIPFIDENTTSGPTWFMRFPGHKDYLPNEVKEYFGSFFPIVRLSNRALKKLYYLVLKGIHGYSEGFVPSVLNYYDFTLDTIFNNQSQSKHFDNKLVEVKHKHNTVDWSWI